MFRVARSGPARSCNVGTGTGLVTRSPARDPWARVLGAWATCSPMGTNPPRLRSMFTFHIVEPTLDEGVDLRGHFGFT